MATTEDLHVGNGVDVLYSFTFPYIKESHIKVSVGGINTTAYTLANATQVQFNSPPSGAIRIYRETDVDSISSEFFPGSSIRAQDLNDNFTQTLYVSQENLDSVDKSDTTASTAVTTANSAVTTANAADTKADTAITNSSAAVTTANAADTKADTAITDSSAAVTTANSASSTASTAATNASTALTTANTAATNASAAVTTANAADTIADAATVTADAADTKADTAISTANTANTNATAAQSAATSAQTSATSAQTSATAAAASAAAAASDAAAGAAISAEFNDNSGVLEVQSPLSVESGARLPVDVSSYAVEGAIRYNSTLDKIELYDGSSWTTAAGGATVGSSPPSPASNGDVWFDKDDGRAYVYYNDGDSSQWVEMNPSWNGSVADDSIGVAKLSATGTAANTTFLRGDNTWQVVDTSIADDSIVEAKLDIHQAPADGKFLKYTSSNGMEWGDVPAGVGGASGVDFNDGVKARFGTGNDMEIYGQANNAGLITNAAGGIDVSVGASPFQVSLSAYNTTDSDTDLTITANSGANTYADLRYDGNVKLATNNTGITVTGTVAATALTGDGSALTGLSSTKAGGAIYENSQTISTTHTLTANTNGMSAGPVTVNSGITLTIPSGATYTVV